jgi:magnesium-transporting ATPase (P-type)
MFNLDYCEFVWAALGDIIIITLILCSIVQTTFQTFGDHRNKDWIDGLAIIFAIVVFVIVDSINNYIKESEFREFQKSLIQDRKVNVIRHGDVKTIPVIAY